MRENFKNGYETTLFYFLEDYAHLWRLDVLLIQNSVEKDDFAKMKNLLTTLYNIKFISNVRIQFNSERRPKRQKSVSAETEISAKLTKTSAEISAETLP